MEEIFKTVPTHPTYQVSNMGRLKTFNWKGSGREAIMKPAINQSGYLRTVALDVNGKLRPVLIHRLVAVTFIDNPLNKPQVNHKNGIKTDNRVENLEWMTGSENCKHSFEIHLQDNRGSKNPISKLDETKVLEIRSKFRKRIYTREMLGKEYGVKASTIKDIILRKSWTHV